MKNALKASYLLIEVAYFTNIEFKEAWNSSSLKNNY